ncbi:hypothetical protein MHU86_5316 [Fragilaria crotonensis]|nr:hypothetical protein MHU86_5316 [Fragilaria crotonensis]
MDRDDNKNSNDNVPLPFMPEPDRLDRRGGRHHHRSSRRQQQHHHGRHPEPDSLQLLDEFMTMERMHNDDDDDYHFSPRRRHEQEPQEQYPPYAAPSSISRHSWDAPDSSSNRREQQLQQQPRGQPHGRHRAMTNNNTTAVSMDHHESLERNTSAPYGSYGGHGPMPHGSSSNLQSSFEPYGIHNNNGSNISPHQNHHYHTSEHHQPYVHNNNNNNNQQQQHHYQPNYVVSANGGTPGPIVTSYPYAVPSSSHHGMPPSFGNSYYGSPSWGPPIQQQQLPLPIVEYIYNIQSSDVLCGRGGATNSHSGNRSFRSLVKRHQDKYLKAKKRDKPGVAALIVDLIRNRGGRFLRRHDESMNHGMGGGGIMNGQHHVLWVDIGNERAREKTCQALREGAPELRRRRSRGASTSSSSDDDNDEDRQSPLQKRKVTSYSEEEEDGNNKAGISSQKVKCEQSTLKRGFDDTAGGGGGNDCNVDDAAARNHHTPVVTTSTSALSASTASTDVRDDLECLQHEQDVPHSEVDENNHDHDNDNSGPMMIRPCPILMRRPVCVPLQFQN